MGVTGLTFAQLQTMTLPQLHWLLARRGRLAWPRVEAAIDARQVEGLHDEPQTDGPSPVQKLLDRHAARKRGEREIVTEKDRRYALAYRLTYARYLGDPDQRPAAEAAAPFPGMGRREARAILAWIAEGDYPMEAWAQLQDRLEEIAAAAKGG